MLSINEAEARAAALVERASRAGADAADALYHANASTSVQVRLGELEDVARERGRGISLRLFVGTRSASVSSSDLRDEALAALVERGIAMAREAPEDPWSGLAPEDRLMRETGPDVEGDDGRDPSPVELKARSLAIEEAGRSVAGITNSEGAGVSAGRNLIALATSHGFCRGYSTTGYSASASLIAGTAARCSAITPSTASAIMTSWRIPRRSGCSRPNAPSRGFAPPSCRAGPCRCCSIPAWATPCSAISRPRSADLRSPAGPASCSTRKGSGCSTRRSSFATIPTGAAAFARSRSTARVCRPGLRIWSRRDGSPAGCSTAPRPGSSAGRRPAMPLEAAAAVPEWAPPTSIWKRAG